MQRVVSEGSGVVAGRIRLVVATEIAKLCGVSEVEVPKMLKRFTDVGWILWHDRPETREMVVINVQWLVDKMTQMLCRRSLDLKWTASGSNKALW